VRIARIARREETRIVVHSIPRGFVASLFPSNSKQELQAHWQEGAGCWRPESSFDRLLRAAQQRPVDLVLPSGFTLAQSVKLPRVALTYLSEAIAYGLSSWSPFEANEVL
jgi:hypothetical protein